MKSYMLSILLLSAGFFAAAQDSVCYSLPYSKVLKPTPRMLNADSNDVLTLSKEKIYYVINAGKEKKPLDSLAKKIGIYMEGNEQNITGKEDVSVRKDGIYISLKRFTSIKDDVVLVLGSLDKNNKLKTIAKHKTKMTSGDSQRSAQQTGPKDEQDKNVVSIASLVECTRLSFGLSDIPLPKDCCCPEKDPCDPVNRNEKKKDSGNSLYTCCNQQSIPGKFDSCPPIDTLKDDIKDPVQLRPSYRKNRIIFQADPPELYYFDGHGRIHYITGDRRHRDIIVHSGAPLAFEIRGANPEAFDISISDSLYREQLEPPMLLQKLLFDKGESLAESITPQSKTGRDSLQVTAIQPCNRQDSMRVACFLVAGSLDAFLKRLQLACPNQPIGILEAKKRARSKINYWIQHTFGLSPDVSFEDFMHHHLDPTVKGDSLLLAALDILYRRLPVAYYRYQYVIPSVPSDINRINFSVNILAKPGLPYLDLTRHEVVPAWVTHGWRPEFSSGLYYAWFQNDRYLLRDDSIVGRNSANTADSVLKRGARLIKGQPGKGEFGFASFLHFSYRMYPAVSLSFNIGAGVSFTEKPRPRYFLGAGAILGKESRLAVQGGLAFGNVDELFDNRYPAETNGDYKWLPAGTSTVDYNTRFVIKPFISISYKLPLTKTTATVKSGPGNSVSPNPADTTASKAPDKSSGSNKDKAGSPGKTKESDASEEVATPTSVRSRVKRKKEMEVYFKH